MSTEAQRLAEARQAMFPKGRVWFQRWKAFGWPIGKGSDEWGRHTFWISLPYIVTVIVAYKWCDCEDTDLDDMRCYFPGCPAVGMFKFGDGPTYCVTHDEEMARSFLAGEYEDVIA